VVIEDAEQVGRRLFLHVKNNLAPPPQGLAFYTEQTQIDGGYIASRVTWNLEPILTTADTAMAADIAGTRTKTEKAEAMEFLQAVLASGPMPVKEVLRLAGEAALTPKVIRAAREALGVSVVHDGFGKGSSWWWSLPTPS
jgi:hypothetical protein